MKYRLTSSALRLEGQPMFKLLGRIKDLEHHGEDIVHFEIGDPDFASPSNVIRRACDSLCAGDTHYTSSMGIREFREVICETTDRRRGFRPDMDQVLVTPGANISIYYAIQCLVEPGDEVIVPNPGFPTYYSAAKFCGASVVEVPLYESNAFKMNPDDVRTRITKKTRLIIMNSPQNPTGAVMTPDEIEEMAMIAEEHDVFLYSDEVYARMIFDQTISFKSPSFRDLCRRRIIVANGFSKAFAMTGWRLGVVIGPKDVIERMSMLLQTTSSCVSVFIQKAGIEAINGDQTEVNEMMRQYRLRRDVLVEGLNSIPGISCLIPGGEIYVFPNISGTGLTSEAFADLMLQEAGVALLPGTNFGRYGEGYVRLCYAASLKRIREGIERMRRVVEQL